MSRRSSRGKNTHCRDRKGISVLASFPKPRKSVRRVLMVMLCVVIVLAFVRYLYVTGPVAIRNGYAGLTLSEMTFVFMEHNDGRWPQSWDDLRPCYESASKRQSSYCTFEEIQSSLEMDFGFNPQEFVATLREGGEVPELNVLSPRVGCFGRWDCCPNERIRAYLARVPPTIEQP